MSYTGQKKNNFIQIQLRDSDKRAGLAGQASLRRARLGEILVPGREKESERSRRVLERSLDGSPVRGYTLKAQVEEGASLVSLESLECGRILERSTFFP